MIQSNNVEIHSIGLHKVGNKYMDEPLELSTELINLDDYIKNILVNYFLSKFNPHACTNSATFF